MKRRVHAWAHGIMRGMYLLGRRATFRRETSMRALWTSGKLRFSREARARIAPEVLQRIRCGLILVLRPSLHAVRAHCIQTPETYPARQFLLLSHTYTKSAGERQASSWWTVAGLLMHAAWRCDALGVSH